MASLNPKYTLHSRLALKFIIIAGLSTVLYSLFVVTLVNKLEDTMVVTLLGHEIDELVVELHQDPNIRMPHTASVSAYLMSRDHIRPVPEHLKSLQYANYSIVKLGDRSYHATVVDVLNDRIYISFDTTDINAYLMFLQVFLIAGGIVIVALLIMTWFWLSKRFLSPVSSLASEVANMNPNDLNIRIEENYKDYEVGLIAQSFDQFMDRMNDYVEREQLFTSAVSHELRTPVAVMTTALDLLELKGVSEQQKGAVNRIKSSANYMQQMITSLLFFARNTDDALEQTLTEICLNDVFTNTVNQYKDQAREKNLSLEILVESSLVARISENHIQIILGNLIQNAINNTSTGKILVTLNKSGFSVKDTGKGVSPDEIDLIVQRSYHGPDSNGYGLGLYLAVKISNIYGLELKINSRVGGGSEFAVLFPDQNSTVAS